MLEYTLIKIRWNTHIMKNLGTLKTLRHRFKYLSQVKEVEYTIFWDGEVTWVYFLNHSSIANSCLRQQIINNEGNVLHLGRLCYLASVCYQHGTNNKACYVDHCYETRVKLNKTKIILTTKKMSILFVLYKLVAFFQDKLVVSGYSKGLVFTIETISSRIFAFMKSFFL